MLRKSDILKTTLVTCFRGFQILLNIAKVETYFVRIFNSWIVLPTKLRTTQLKMILQLVSTNEHLYYSKRNKYEIKEQLCKLNEKQIRKHALCYGHKSSTGTVRRLCHRTASLSPKIVRFYGARTAPGRWQKESYDF